MQLSRSILIMVLAVSFSARAIAGGDSKMVLDGKTYTLHKVRVGETLLSITKEYNASIFDLKKVNRLVGTDNSVKVGDILIIPLDSPAAPQAAPQQPKPVAATTVAPAGGEVEHTVMPGETLFGIARQYHTTPPAIKALNNMADNSLRSGQKLRIPVAGKTPPPTPAPKPTVTTSTTVTTTTTTVQASKPAPEKVTDAAADKSVDPNVDTKMLNQLKGEFQAQSKSKRTIEAARGVATVMADNTSENQSKFYAFHKNAPIGTVLKVRNLMNNKTAYVKVIGKLPENMDTQNVMVKVSAATAKYLTVLDAKFQCEVTEYK